jgi:hypothetical protein
MKKYHEFLKSADTNLITFLCNHLFNRNDSAKNTKFEVVQFFYGINSFFLYFIIFKVNLLQAGEFGSCSECFQSLIRDLVVAEVNLLQAGEFGSCSECFQPLIGDLVAIKLNSLQTGEFGSSCSECFQSLVRDLIVVKIYIHQFWKLLFESRNGCHCHQCRVSH